MKAREPRRQVMISARLRDGLGWTEARILNVSSRGLLLHASKPPERGSYVEIWGGARRIVARVVWARQGRFGVRTQDEIIAEAMVAGGKAADGPGETPGMGHGKWRLSPQLPARLERSRKLGRSMQFLWASAVGVAAATLAFDAVKGSLARPLATVSAELVRKH